MTRSVALRASALFVLFAALFAGVGIASQVPVAEALFLISGSLCAVLLVFAGFAASTPMHVPVPVRVRRNRRHR